MRNSSADEDVKTARLTHNSMKTRARQFVLTSLLGASSLRAADPASIPVTQMVASRNDGTHIVLRAVPDYVERIFVPVIPVSSNSFAITSRAIDAVLEAPAGYEIDRHNGGLRIEAPAGEAAGYARVRIGNRELKLTLVNLIPYEQVRDGRLEGYRIGEYREAPLRGLASYERPKGFLRLSRANGELWVSDHYRLRDFQCKLDGAMKFLVLRTEALLKLEILQHELEKSYGLHFDHFTIMSGYRTPYYNAMIGNETSYSRHVYGDAMDIYIDTDGDGVMDDINRDGRVDADDAQFLLQVAEKIDNSAQWGWLKGGAGVYHANAAHGPYLHIDARGYVARWGV